MSINNEDPLPAKKKEVLREMWLSIFWLIIWILFLGLAIAGYCIAFERIVL